jgi:hypothetical protein
MSGWQRVQEFAMRPLLFSLLVLANQAMAGEGVMSAEEFDSYATGKTLTYSSAGQVYGAEQYLPGRRVRWAFKDDSCHEGRWYEDQGQICFVYDNEPVPQCWEFQQTEAGVTARFAGDEAGTELSELSSSTQPLACAGPDVGV